MELTDKKVFFFYLHRKVKELWPSRSTFDLTKSLWFWRKFGRFLCHRRRCCNADSVIYIISLCKWVVNVHTSRLNSYCKKQGTNSLWGPLQPSYKHGGVLSKTCWLSAVFCFNHQSYWVEGLLSVPITQQHSWPLRPWNFTPGCWEERVVGPEKRLSGLGLHCWGSLCHSSVTQKTSSSACPTMAFRSLERNDWWLTRMHGLIEPELIWSLLRFFYKLSRKLVNVAR